MGAGHTHRLYRAGDSPLHRLPPQCKLLATLVFVFCVVATPREQMWAFGVYALLLGAVAAVGRIPPGFVARRLVIEVPFLLFMGLMPFVGHGDRVDVLGLSLSQEGLWAAWNVWAKATLGVGASILLAATTEPRDLLLGVERLKVPPLLTQIATFMLRYADVILDELRRMRIARASRGFVPRDLRDLRVLGRSVGALFIRSYERGERVYLAMISRGYTGQMPVIDRAGASAAQWATAFALPAAALLVVAGAWMDRWTLM